MGYRSMGHIGNRSIWGNRVQGYGYRIYGTNGQWVQGMWATWAMGVQGYGAH